MFLARYFLYVGAALLALLFVADAYLPKPAESAPVAEYVRPMVRIHSALKLPERIVIDTSIPTIIPQPPVVAAAPASTTVADVPAKPPALNALAEMTPADLKKSEAKVEPKAPPKRRIAKRPARPPVVAYAQAPRFDFDFFGRY